MMNYYQDKRTPNNKQQKEKSINTNFILYLTELPQEVDQYDLHQHIMSFGDFNIESLIVRPTKDKQSFAYVKFKTKAEGNIKI